MIKKSIAIGVLISLFSCQSENYIPKPIGYSRLDYPAHNYVLQPTNDCPFVFELGSTSNYVEVPAAIGQRCWFNIEYPIQNAKIHVSYLDIQPQQLETFISDARKLALEHLAKADDFEENVIYDPQAKVFGVVYDFQGGTASNMQFYLTDSTSHFIRGALYFHSIPNPDSLAPAEQYVEEELMHLINSFQWK
tara:strand:- start:26001 stop:26576 length:576 start_codon:yes stop_codon:yes gene_type:complete